MDNLLLRDAVLEDLPFLKEFEQEIIKAERPFDPTIRQDPVSYYDLIQKIIECLKEWAVRQGLNEVRLTVYHDNIPAIKAYEKSGFKSHLNEMRIRLKSY